MKSNREKSKKMLELLLDIQNITSEEVKLLEIGKRLKMDRHNERVYARESRNQGNRPSACNSGYWIRCGYKLIRGSSGLF